MTSILQFSDIHFGSEDKSAMAAVRDFAMALKPDVFLICGDITQNGSSKEFIAAQDWIKTFPGPKLITPGNHDTPMFNVLARAFWPFRGYNKYIRPMSEPYYADDNVMIVPHNTARGLQWKLDWSLGVINLQTLKADIRNLDAARPGSLKMLAVHHPLIYPSVSPLQKTTKNGAEALNHLSDANIDAVLSGHVHTPFVAHRDPGKTELLSIGSGTLSTRRRGQPASFNHLHIDSDICRVTAYDWIGGAYVKQCLIEKPRRDLSAQRPLGTQTDA